MTFFLEDKVGGSGPWRSHVGPRNATARNSPVSPCILTVSHSSKKKKNSEVTFSLSKKKGSQQPFCFSVTSTSSTPPPVHQPCRPWRLRPAASQSSSRRARRSSALGATTSPTPTSSAIRSPRCGSRAFHPRSQNAPAIPTSLNPSPPPRAASGLISRVFGVCCRIQSCS